MLNFGLTTPRNIDSGDFSLYKPIKPIPTNLYGLLPQLKWYRGNACVPTALANTLAGMAKWYETPDLLESGADQHKSLLNTMMSVSEYTKTTDEGTLMHTNGITGLRQYFESRSLEKNFSTQWVGGKYYKGESKDQRIKSQRYFFQSLIRAMAKGPIVFADTHLGNGGHALTAVSLEINDKNKDLIIQPGEAYAYIIDPLDPASNYSPKTLDVGNRKGEEKLNFLNRAFQAAPDASANLKKVEIFQDFNRKDDYSKSSISGALTFNYDQTYAIWDTPSKEQFYPDEQLVTLTQEPANKSKGTTTGFIALQYSALPDDIVGTISENISKDSIIIDFSNYLVDNQIDATLFSYFNESSAFSNKVGFYQLAGTSGTIIDPISGQQLNPGDAGYLTTALTLAEQFEASDTNSADDDLDDRVSADQTQMGNFSFSLNGINGKALFAPIVTTSEGNSWTTFAAANLDGKNHFQSIGDLSFQVEDQFGLGDADFNDLQVILTPLKINGVA